jgi:DNA modification methylase
MSLAPARSEPDLVPVNSIARGDCLTLLRAVAGDIADLVYLDPPFNTGQSRVDREGTFHDSWASTESYIEFLRPRLLELHRILKSTGAILLHCDWRTCHHVRVLLDEVFGAERFVNHLIWRYGLGGSSPRRFARKHDDILFYARSPSYYFDPPQVPATSQRMKGQMKKAGDVLDIPAINNMAVERTGYPTQKPLELLRLLIGACSPPGGLVIDPFCGSGTTCIAARELGRRYLGIDSSPDAVTIARARLSASGQRLATRTRRGA